MQWEHFDQDFKQLLKAQKDNYITQDDETIYALQLQKFDTTFRVERTYSIREMVLRSDHNQQLLPGFIKQGYDLRKIYPSYAKYGVSLEFFRREIEETLFFISLIQNGCEMPCGVMEKLFYQFLDWRTRTQFVVKLVDMMESLDYTRIEKRRDKDYFVKYYHFLDSAMSQREADLVYDFYRARWMKPRFPLSLSELSRITFRRSIPGSHFADRVMSLPLPYKCKQYLLFKI